MSVLPRGFTAHVEAVTPLTDTVRLWRFALAHDASSSADATSQSSFQFTAGQYVNIAIPPHAGREAATRAYSLASAPCADGTFEILANLVPTGTGSPYLFSMQPGDTVQMEGPHGSFHVDLRGTRDYLFIATGTGIAPLRAMMQTLIAQPTTRQITLLWGVRHPTDLYFQEEFHALARAHANFTFVMTLSKPHESWAGECWRVTDVLPRLVTSVKDIEVYVCGQRTMIDDVRAYLKTLGLCPVKTEKFY